MQGEALKLRLSRLKKASVELKSKVLNEPKVNYEVINSILSTVLPQPYLDKQALQQSNHLNSETSNSLVKNPYTSIPPRISHSNNYSQGSSVFLIPPMVTSSMTVPGEPSVLKSIPEKNGGTDLNTSRASAYSKDPFDN